MESFDIHLEPVRAILFQIGAFLPRLLIAVRGRHRRLAARQGGALRASSRRCARSTSTC